MMSDLAKPYYPLEKAAFVRALATGHGRAMIHAQRFGVEDFRDEILDAALFPKVYDTQCNGYGEEWLARLCAMAGLVETIICRSHGTEGGDGALRCRLLKEFALQGHAAARPALREMCRFDAEWNDLLACGEIVALEGEEGFVFVAERLGERLQADKEFWVASWVISLLDEKCGEGTAMAILERESQRSPRIAAYREAVLEWQAKCQERPDRSRPAVDEIIGLILTSDKRVPRLMSYGKNATEEERRKVAALEFQKMEAVSLENYLSYFCRAGFPEFREEHLALLGHAGERVRWRAHAVLSHHADPAVRKAAYEDLAQGEYASFVRLLRSSGLADDTEPLLEALRGPATGADRDERHDIGFNLLELIETNQAMNDVRLPVWIYEYSPCMCCRYAVVKRMVAKSILPAWVAEECLSDAEEDIRKMAAEYSGAQP